MGKNLFTNRNCCALIMVIVTLVICSCHSQNRGVSHDQVNYPFATICDSSLNQQIKEFSKNAKLCCYRKLLSLTINCINQDTIQYKLASICGFCNIGTDLIFIAKVNDIYVLVRINPINDFSLPSDTVIGQETPITLIELLRQDYPQIYDEYLKFKNAGIMTEILAHNEYWILTYVKDSLVSREKFLYQ